MMGCRRGIFIEIDKDGHLYVWERAIYCEIGLNSGELTPLRGLQKAIYSRLTSNSKAFVRI